MNWDTHTLMWVDNQNVIMLPGGRAACSELCRFMQYIAYLAAHVTTSGPSTEFISAY